MLLKHGLKKNASLDGEAQWSTGLLKQVDLIMSMGNGLWRRRAGASKKEKEEDNAETQRALRWRREEAEQGITKRIDRIRYLRKYIRIMRKIQILEALFPDVRQGILAATLLTPEKAWFLSELAAHLETSPSSLQREVESLAKSGILARRQDGRRTYYQADASSPVFEELRSLFSKTAGVVPVLKSELERFGDKISWAAAYGSFARGQERGASDIDLLIVGAIGMTEIVPGLRRLEERFGREVNVTRYSVREFLAKRNGGERFLNSVLKGKLITVIGSADELEKTTSRRKSSRPQSK